MRIAVLSTFYPFRGGIAQFSTALFRALEHEHDTKAFTFTRQYPEFLFPGKTQLVEGNDADDVRAERLLDSINPFTYNGTAKAIFEYRPDLLIINQWMGFFAPGFGRVASLCKPKMKVMAIMHNVIPHEPRFFDKPFTQYLLRNLNEAVVLTEAVGKDLQEWNSSLPFKVIPHPYYDHFGSICNQTDARRSLNLSSEKKTLLFFGFIRKYKGLDLLIEAFGKLDESYQLLVVGESYEDFGRYQELIDSSPNKSRIHVHERYISDGEVPQFFGACDLCVLPYRSATQSGIANIAMHFERPVLASDVGGISEMIQDGQNGLLISDAEPEKIEKAILKFFNEELGRGMRVNIKNLKAANTWKRFAERMLNY